MQFDPNKRAPEIVAGIFKFTCTKAKEGAGKQSGEPYIKVNLAVHIPGNDIALRGGTFLSINPRMIFKLKHFCECGGQPGLDKFETGDITADDCIGVEGWAKFVPDVSNAQYNDLEVIDFLPERKLAELTGEDLATYGATVTAYGVSEDAEFSTIPTTPAVSGSDDPFGGEQKAAPTTTIADPLPF